MIWIIGGTSESFEIIRFIGENGDLSKYIISVTTKCSKDIIEKINSNIKVIAKPMDFHEIKNFISEMKIQEIIDISHPYAKEITNNTIEACKKFKIPYTRYQRKLFFNENNYNYFSTVDEIGKYCETLQGNILITLGSNSINKFLSNKNLNNLYFRIIPDSKIIETCIKNKISPKNIIAMYGPFSKEINIATINQYNIKSLVTKSSGKNGGEQEKIDAALETKCEVIFLQPPQEPIYGSVIDSIEKLKEKLI